MSIDVSDRARVPAGVRTGGQFATEARGEADVSLLDPASVPSVEDYLVRVIAPAVADGGPAFDSIVRQEFDRLVELVGPDVPAEYVAAVFEVNHRLRQGDYTPLGSRWAAASPQAAMYLRDAYETGMPADWPDQMEARNAAAEPARKAAWDAAAAAGHLQGLTYSPAHDWSSRCVERWAKGLTADELARLDAAGLALRPEVAAAYVGCDTPTIHQWLNAATRDPQFGKYVNHYLGYQGIGQYVRAGVPLDDVRLCHELGAEPGLAMHGLTRPDGTVEKGPDAIRELVAYSKAAGQSTDEAREGIAAGLPASALKEYGPRVAACEISYLQTAGVPGKVARSLRARDRAMSATFIGWMHRAGISTGADYKTWEAVVEERVPRGMSRGYDTVHDWDTAATLSAAGVPASTALALRRQRVPLRAVADFHSAGISDAAPWTKAAHPRAQGVLSNGSEQELAAYRAIASFAAAGGTPEQMQRAQRAGVPLADLPAHVASTREQLWAAGASNRDAVMAEERRRFDAWGAGYAPAPAGWDCDGPEDL